MTKTNLLVAIFCMLFTFNSLAQKHRAFQFSFVTPIGTNGNQSYSTSNDFSLNLLLGASGGTEKMEIGGLANLNSGTVHGFQLAGITNINQQNTHGITLSGISNILSGETTGVQLSGVSNLINHDANGVQISGVSNMIGGSASGFQLSTLNLVKKDFSGVQLGVFNRAKSLKGMQIGVINIADSTENGIPLGLINIVRGGYYALELSSSESMKVRLTYKMGVERLYTLFSFAYDNYKNKDLFSYGAGLGTLIPLGSKHKLALEAICNELVYDNSWDDLNLLNQLKANFHIQLSPGFSIFAGPSYNLYLTEKKLDGKYGSIDKPWTIYDHTGGGKKLFMWIGCNAGVSLRF